MGSHLSIYSAFQDMYVYLSMSARYRLVPIAGETLGVSGVEALVFFRDLGQRITATTAEPRSFQYLRKP